MKEKDLILINVTFGQDSEEMIIGPLMLIGSAIIIERSVGELPLRRDDRHPVSVLTGDLPQEATEGEAGVVRLHREMLRRSGARSPLGRSP